MKIEDRIRERVIEKRVTLVKFLGYGNRPTPPIITRKIDEELLGFKKLLEVGYAYRLFDENGNIFGDIIYTVGERIEKVIQHYISTTEAIRGVILDKIAILCLDVLKEMIFEEIYEEHKIYREREWVPGSTDFPLSKQGEIYRRIGNIDIITINDAYQLFPIKSVALRAQFSKNLTLQNPCESCEIPCEGMRTKEESMLAYIREKSKTYTKDLYARKGIPDTVYQDNMKDISFWADRFTRSTGSIGINKENFFWLNDILEGKVIKLGRLQFEILSCERVPEILFSEYGSSAIFLNVHIREGEPLSPDQCRISYDFAANFFLEQSQGQASPNREALKAIVFLCDSWLLNPDIIELLPRDSNIIQFQSHFTLLSKDLKSRQMEERVFGYLTENPNDYPETTILQKSLKTALQEGMTYGTAMGFFIRDIL